MQLPLYIVDAFTQQRFAGNPAAVVPLTQWLPVPTMQSIASENNLAETAFLVWSPARQAYEIRWFSPLKEIDFCGHATLASAHVLFRRHAGQRTLRFWAAAVGSVEVVQLDGGRIRMSFPNRAPHPVAEPPQALIRALTQGQRSAPLEVLQNQQAFFAVYGDEQAVRDAQPDLELLKQLAPLDVVVTAPASAQAPYDFVSRYFWPANGGAEDPVTGSIHAGLAPLWAQRLGRVRLLACQASQRSGLLHCEVDAALVHVAGDCVAYLEGTITV